MSYALIRKIPSYLKKQTKENNPNHLILACVDLIERTKTSKKKCCYIFINIHHGIGRMH
jgi:hypothetical protein